MSNFFNFLKIFFFIRLVCEGGEVFFSFLNVFLIVIQIVAREETYLLDQSA